MTRFTSWLSLAMCLFMAGCRKPYHEDLLVDIATSEVAILIETQNSAEQAVTAPPGKGDVTDTRLQSVDFYKTRVVQATRVTIPYYWKQTHLKGYLFDYDNSSNGRWVPAARLITINTEPETRKWHSDTGGGINAESLDSVGFSTGISITARIEDRDDAILFLSNYPPKAERVITALGGDEFKVEVTSLEQIMDDEVKTKIQEVYAYESAGEIMDDLRGKKREIIDRVQEIVVPFFKERGITITSIGQFGGFTYENAEIQQAIDDVFKAQQDEEVAKAESKAAEVRKDALRLKGEGEASQILESSKGKAEGIRIEAEAEAEAIKLVADAKKYEIEQANADLQTYLALKALDIQLEKAERWDGKLPVTNFGGQESGGNFLFSVPSTD